MSKVIDEKVVQMRFDNSQFEKNVSTSMSTLDKLKKSLNLDGAAKGLEQVNSAAKNFDISGLSNGVEIVKAKFSALQVMAVTALGNITNTAVNAGKRLVAAFTIDPIKTGFAEYETQINAVQTILANTQSKGSTLKDVNEALDELNHYADMTIYNFTEMTRNIGTFTAAGVDLETSVSAIKGIANLAAVSGSTSQQASTAMYQLSQALAAGTVKLMDWNSVVNAGMGGQVFQDALKETARVHHINIDKMIKDEGAFRETLKNGWLTSKILTETLSKFTGDLSAEQLKSMGYGEKQIKEIMKLGKTANDAATKVKTFTQLMDTLKEAAQSGWTQTWEILVGDFEEAKALLTEVSDYFSEVLGKSANARNDVLQSWKDMGGRTMLIESVKNVFEGLLTILKPIKEAFQEIFPPITAKQLLVITERIKELTSKFKLNDAQAEKLKATFKGLFSVAKIGINVITKIVGGVATLVGKLFGFSGTLLDITGSLGNFVSKISSSIISANLFGKAIDKIVGFLSNAIDKTKKFTSAVNTKIKATSYEVFLKILSKIWEIFGKIGKYAAKIGKGISTGILAIGRALVNAFENGNIEALMGIVNSGIMSSILLSIRKFIKGFKDFKKSINDTGGIKNNIVDVLNGVKDCLESLQKSIKAGIILKIAAAVGVLAVSLLVISKIPTEKLGSSLGSITILLTEMMGAVAIFNKINGKYTGAFKASVLMIGISTALLVLASGLKKLSSLSWGELSKGLVGVLGLMSIIVGAMKILSTNSKHIIKGAGQMVAIAFALKILASACKDLSAFDWKELAKGVSGVGILMAEIAAFLKLTKNSKQAISSAIGIVIIASAMKIMASACKDFAQCNWVDLAKGSAALGGILVMVAAFDIVAGKSQKLIRTATSLVIIGAAMKMFASAAKEFAKMNWVELGKAGAAFGGILIMVAAFDTIAGKSKSLLKSAISLVVVGTALEILQNVLKKMGNVSWEEYGKQMAVFGGSLLILSVALIAMKETIPGAAALLIATAALNILAGVLKKLGSMSWGSVIKGFISIAGLFLILGAAGYLLGPIVPVILSLSGAVALFGLGCLAAGAGIIALSAGLASLAVVTVQAAASIVATLHILIVGFLELIPSIINALTDAVVALCEVITRSAPAIGKAVKALVLVIIDVIVECVPEIADGTLKVIVGVLGALVEYTPEIVDLLFKFFIGIIDALGQNVPKLIQAFVNMLSSIFSGAIKSLGNIDIDVLLKGVACVGFLTAIALGLAALAVVAPLSMVGVLALGAVITELAVVLAEVGVLAQMPGLKWLIDEGSDLLYSIGNALGQFVGGIVGGVAEGTSKSLPKIANNLSVFMTNLQPFLNGASKINSSTFDGVMALTKVIIALTAADLLDGITSWITGGSSLTKFAKQLAPFGEAITEFSSIISGNIDEESINAAANAGKLLTEMSKTIPNSGGIVSWFAGDNDLSKFSEKLVSFGEAITEFSETVSGKIDDGAVSSASNAGKVMAEMVKAIPKTKGIFNRDMYSFVSQLKKFGEGIINFSKQISEEDAINGPAIESAAAVGKNLAETASSLPNLKEKDLGDFGKQLKAFGKGITNFSKQVSGENAINSSAIISAANVGKKLAETASALPNIGDKNLGTFGTQLKGFGEGISSFSKQISGINSDVLSANIDGIKNVIAKMNEVSITGLDNFVDSFSKAETKSISSITKTLNSSVSKIDKYKSKFSSSGKDLIKEFIKGLKTDSAKVSEPFTKALTSATTSLRTYYNSFRNAGKYIAQGFADGIKANSYKAAVESKAMAEAAATAAKKALNINSPSKVFRAIAYSIPEGFAQGIDRKSWMVEDSAISMAESAVNNTKNVISRIADSINSDVDTQPTIRPILDLSDVSSGADSINGMFSMNPSVGVMSNIRSISSMMNNQNRVNDDVVSAIESLGKKMNNSSGDVYNFGDITYDDGSNVSEAVKSMIRAIRVERRT